MSTPARGDAGTHYKHECHEGIIHLFAHGMHHCSHGEGECTTDQTWNTHCSQREYITAQKGNVPLFVKGIYHCSLREYTTVLKGNIPLFAREYTAVRQGIYRCSPGNIPMFAMGLRACRREGTPSAGTTPIARSSAGHLRWLQSRPGSPTEQGWRHSRPGSVCRGGRMIPHGTT